MCAATFLWCEDNGALTSSHGTVQTGWGGSGSSTDVNWKNHDDCSNGTGGTAYTANPITAGNNSYVKYQYGYFSGSFNQISAGLFAHTAGTLGTGLTLEGAVTSTYATPVTTTLSATNMTTAISIGSGAAVSFSATGPWGGSPTSTLTVAGYSQYLQTQLQTTTSAAAGDCASVTISFVYNEN
jgi:hypothetical protein